ncbi:MAG: hypothetical protein QNJ22_17505 [Desulfosarcinaceae bacterium]|nr:hypothetical protein [Desulfosarcinaceae bacterium]
MISSPLLMGKCRWPFLLIGLLVLQSLGCAKSPRPAPQTVILSKYQQVALLPFANATALYGEGQQVRNPFTSKVFNTGPVPEEAAETLTQILWEQLQAKTLARILPPAQSVGERAELISETTLFSERRLVAELGRRQGADAVLMGTLYRYRERVGLKYAADTPAAVTFDLLLLETASGQVVWWRSFDEVQQPLSENLLKLGTFIKDRGRWLTAAQMGSRALDEMTTALAQP